MRHMSITDWSLVAGTREPSGFGESIPARAAWTGRLGDAYQVQTLPRFIPRQQAAMAEFTAFGKAVRDSPKANNNAVFQATSRVGQ